jgi:hypothetical protein
VAYVLVLVSLLVHLLLLKTIESQYFEMAVPNDDTKELLQTWYQLDGHA